VQECTRRSVQECTRRSSARIMLDRTPTSSRMLVLQTQCASLGRRLLACDRQMVVHATTDGLVLAVQGKAHAATAIVSTVAVAALFHRGQTFAALVRHTVMADDMLRAGLEEAAVYLLHGGWQVRRPSWTLLNPPVSHYTCMLQSTCARD
jgi:hypothetical protein